MKFTSVQVKSIGFSKTHFGQSDVDLNKAHKKIGFDTLNGVFDPKTGSVKIDVSFDTKGGFMYFHLHSTSQSTFAGKITGGTGNFKHDTESSLPRLHHVRQSHCSHHHLPALNNRDPSGQLERAHRPGSGLNPEAAGHALTSADGRPASGM